MDDVEVGETLYQYCEKMYKKRRYIAAATRQAKDSLHEYRLREELLYFLETPD